MKRAISVAILLMFVFIMIIGCGKTMDSVSSQQEAIFVVSNLPKFKKLISAKSVYGEYGWIYLNKVFYVNEKYYVVHTIVYEDKTGDVKVTCLDDKRPPMEIE